MFGDFLWSLDTPEAFPWGVDFPGQGACAPFAPYATCMGRGSRGVAEVHRWARQWRDDRQRHESDQPDSHGDRSVRMVTHGLVLDVRNGDLIEGYYGRPTGKHTVRWSAITLRRPSNPDKRNAGTAMTGRKRGPSRKPCARKTSGTGTNTGGTRSNRCRRFTRPSRTRSNSGSRRSGNVPDIGDIRRNIVVPLYAGKRTRGRRKR